MSYDWIDAYCLAKKGVTKDYQPEWEATRYFVGGKMFAMQGGDREEKPIFTVKLEPSLGDFLRRQFPGKLVPGYHMNKEHWNSLYLDSDVPKEAVRDMIDKAYLVTLAALSRKKQKEILE